MPKMKTKRAAAKRFKTTGTGKLMKMKANKDGLIAGLEERLDRLKKEDDAHEKQSAA